MDIKYFLLIIYSIIYAILSFLLLNIYILFHFQFFRTKIIKNKIKNEHKNQELKNFDIENVINTLVRKISFKKYCPVSFVEEVVMYLTGKVKPFCSNRCSQLNVKIYEGTR